MIHDIILACLDMNSRWLPIDELVISNAVNMFFHPCEKKLLKKITKNINLLREIAKFSLINARTSGNILASGFDTYECLQMGLYLKAFANGIGSALDEYFNSITDTETVHLHNPRQSLTFVYQKLQEYEPLALYLSKLIRAIRIQKIHGCAIIKYIEENSVHGNVHINNSIKIIQSAVNVVFLKQLIHWMLYGNLIDSYREFFIQYLEHHWCGTPEKEGEVTAAGIENRASCMSDVTSNYSDIWRYAICYELLPHYLSSTWAEKVMFIGQTVLMFKAYVKKVYKNDHVWKTIATNYFNHEQSLWNEKEHIYFAKIQSLQYDLELNNVHYDNVVDEIKSYVSSRLSEIAINQADLVHQLKLIKDFFLMGRGELFLEFIRQTYTINKDPDDDSNQRNFINAFESAAHGVGVSEELEQFSLYIPQPPFDPTGRVQIGNLQSVQLQYKIIWPLHLLLSPVALDRYNRLFRFLLIIKKIQYDLHMLWCRHTRESKTNVNRSICVMHLRNQLTFFVDNLQYYIQVDVLESQFSILLNAILSNADFEQVQKLHSIFQADILSLCFLLTYEGTGDDSMLKHRSPESNNPIYLIICEIFHISEEFCTLVNSQMNDDILIAKIEVLDKRFGNLILQLINLLVSFKAAPSKASLSQLLLRLDFNHWFSIKKNYH